MEKCALQFTHPQVYAKYSQKLCVNRHRVSEKKDLLNLFEIFQFARIVYHHHHHHHDRRCRNNNKVDVSDSVVRLAS